MLLLVTRARSKLAGDTSLMTYRGHCVLNTLLRSRFSPMFNTGQRYIYVGCATGAVVGNKTYNCSDDNVVAFLRRVFLTVQHCYVVVIDAYHGATGN